MVFRTLRYRIQQDLIERKSKVMISAKPVIVLQLPEQLVVGRAQLFFREIEAFLKADRPCLVFDFSAVSRVDSAGVEMLLNSMEEVMKRNGDLKLAAIPHGAATILKLTKVDGLFDIFDDTYDAVESFRGLSAYSLQASPAWSGGSPRESGRAM